MKVLLPRPRGTPHIHDVGEWGGSFAKYFEGFIDTRKLVFLVWIYGINSPDGVSRQCGGRDPPPGTDFGNALRHFLGMRQSAEQYLPLPGSDRRFFDRLPAFGYVLDELILIEAAVDWLVA